MGHQIGKPEHPARGSQAFIPKVRAKRVYPRIKSWPETDDVRLLGFAGYKAGMAHVTFIDNSSHSQTKGEKISVPVTILDVPKMRAFSIRIYGKNDRKQNVCLAEVRTDKLDKELSRKLSISNKKNPAEEALKKAEERINDAEDVKLTVYTLPKGRFGKKKPDIFEIAIGGKTAKEKFDYAKSLLGKELTAKDALKSGEIVDIIAVTKGKGFQGAIKRSGAKLQPRNKSDRGERMIASIGPDRPRKVNWRVAMPGQMGFHNRFDFNKWILKIGENGSDVTPKAGFLKYGNVKEEYIMLMGSVPGASKRLIRMRLALKPRKNIPSQAPEILTVSKVEMK